MNSSHSMGVFLVAFLGTGCTPTGKEIVDTADTGVGDVEAITADPADCGYSVGFAWPLNPTDPSDWEDHLYYGNRDFLQSSSYGAHLGADFLANEGDKVFAGVTGKLVEYRTSGGYDEDGNYSTSIGYSFAAVVASFIEPSMTWTNGDEEETTTSAYLTIYGHIRSTSELSGGEATGLQAGDCVTPETLLGYIQNKDYNGDGDEHLHYGVRLQSAEDARAVASDYFAGYESDGWRTYYADPIDPLSATIVLEDWAHDSVDSLHDAGILAEDSTGYVDRITWNRAEVAHILAGVLDLESSDVYGDCACPFEDVDAGADWYADDVCTLTWLEYGDGVTPFRNESGNLIAFNPGQLLTRVQFLKVLLESYDVDKVSSGADFDDVEDAPEDLQVYIHTADDLGLLGHDSDSFRPNDVITKGEIAVFVARAVDHEDLGRPTPDANDYSDDPNSQCGGGW